MNDSIVVDIAGLATLRRDIDSLGGVLRQTTSTAAAHAIPDPTVSAALASVTRDWSSARAGIAQFLEGVGAAVDAASMAYGEIEQGVCRAAATPPARPR